MSDRMTPLDDARDLIFLLSHSAKFMPDNPTMEGWDSDRIKKAYWYPIKILYEWLKRAIDEAGEVELDLDGLKEALSNGDFVPLETTYAEKDSQGNVIHTTYATDASVVHNTGAETIAGNKTFSGETRFNGAVYSASIYPTSGAPKFLGFSDKKWETVYTNSIYLYNGIIHYGSYKIWLRQQSGHIALESYVDAAEATLKAYADAEIGKLLGGDYVAKRAKSDEAGNDIQSTYVKIASIVNTLTSDATNVPLSAYQGKVLKKAIDDILNLLQSDDDALDEIREIVAYIKSNRSLIDGITTAKISYSDIVDDLNSQLATKPLSAKQGYVLDQKKIDKADIEDSLNSSSATKVLSANQGRILAGQIANVSAAYDAKIEELEEWADAIDDAEAGRVEAERGRVEAELGRVAAEEAREGRIEALESGLAETKELAKIAYFAHGSTLSTVSDTTLAAIKAVPAGAQRFASLDGFKGNSLAWNQWCNNGTNSTAAAAHGITFTNNGDGSWTLNGTADGEAVWLINTNQIPAMASKKVLWGLDNKYVSGVKLRDQNTYLPASKYQVSEWTSSTTPVVIAIVVANGTVLDNVKVYPRFTDLTQMYDAGNEPTSVTDPKAIFAIQYAQAHPEFNEGKILDSLPTKLYSRKAGLNSLKLNEIGAYTFTGNETLEIYTDYVAFSMSAYITGCAMHTDYVNPANLYMEGFETKAWNASVDWSSGKYIRAITTEQMPNVLTVRIYGVTSASQLAGKTIMAGLTAPASTISQAVIDGLVIAEYPLTLPTLRSAGSVQDTDKKKNVVNYTFTGEENFTETYENEFTVFNVLPNVKHWTASQVPEAIMPGYAPINANYLGQAGNGYFTIFHSSGNSLLRFRNSSYHDNVAGFKTSLIGKTVNYELANPTDQSGVEIPDLIEVEEGGSLELVCTGTTAEFDVTYLVEAE